MPHFCTFPSTIPYNKLTMTTDTKLFLALLFLRFCSVISWESDSYLTSNSWVACNNKDPASGLCLTLLSVRRFARHFFSCGVVDSDSKSLIIIYQIGLSCVMDVHSPQYSHEPAFQNDGFHGAATIDPNMQADSDRGGIGSKVFDNVDVMM
mmetsp:Transcript_58752/g.155435  ORF Transcript_58752/g.155435 Transcript_58752/m.155435 type:complete len:151 (-) Transcript_58752:568-1020(-)